MSVNNSKEIMDAITDSIGDFVQSITTLVEKRKTTDEPGDDKPGDDEPDDDKIAKRAIEQFIESKKDDDKLSGKPLDIVNM